MNISTILSKITSFVTLLTIALFALGVVVFVYGLFTYLLNISDKTKREQSKQYIVYGILGLFIMLTVWGFVTMFSSALGFGDAKIIPTINF
jgi:uncharacterized membrane protein